MVRGVIIFLLLAEICRFPDEIPAATRVERRHAAFGKFEMIGAVKAAFLGLTIRFHLSSVACRGCT